MQSYRPVLSRKSRGGVLAEFPPVFMILILLFIIPMIDFLAMAICYGCGAILNYNAVREASLVSDTVTSTTVNNANGGVTTTNTHTPDIATMQARVIRMTNQWHSQGVGQFMKVKGPIQIVIKATGRKSTTGQPDANNNITNDQSTGTLTATTTDAGGGAVSTSGTTSNDLDDYVKVTQTLTVDPFLYIPFFPIKVSGINDPMTFTFSGDRMVENAT